MALTITSPSIVSGFVGVPFEYQGIASGGVEPYIWHIHSVTTWESIDESSGWVTGTPTIVEVKTISLHVHDSAGAAALRNVRIVVEEPVYEPVRWQSGDTHLPGFQAGQKEN